MRSVALPALVVLAFGSAFGSASAHADKRRETAQLLSGFGAAASGVLVLTGALWTDDHGDVNRPVFYTGVATSIITPSLGEWYADEWFTPGMAVRIAASGLATFALERERTIVTCDYAQTYDQKCKVWSGTAIALLGLAAIAYVGGSWYDALDAGDAVDRYHRRHGMSVTPMVLPTPSGVTPGMSLTGAF